MKSLKKLIEEYKNLRMEYESLREDIVNLRKEKESLERELNWLRKDIDKEKGRLEGIKELYGNALRNAMIHKKRKQRNGTTFMDMEKATGYEIREHKVKVYR